MFGTCACKQRHLGYYALAHRNGVAAQFQAGGDNILYIETFLGALLKSHLIGDHLIRVTR